MRSVQVMFLGGLLLAFLGCGKAPDVSRTLNAFVPPDINVTFTEINLDWFGLNSNPQVGGSETRVASIREFLQSNNLLSDVMVFEEIIDLDLLATGLLASQFQCHSYQRVDPKHQHVAICVKSGYRFDLAEDSTGYDLASIDITGGLRPAVHGILKTADGQRLAHVFGLHLKADSKPTSEATRMKQTETLAAYLQQLQQHDPVILMGDFNTYGDDPVNMEKAYQPVGLVELNTPEEYTWASTIENFPPAKFDRIWISNTLGTAVSNNHVVGPCNGSDQTVLAAYNKAVSDHCATTMTLKL